MKIEYRLGDATNPQGEGVKVIAHICNNIRAWGAGFVMALSKKWSRPEVAYRNLPVNDLILGFTQFVDADTDIIVANMVAQDNVRTNIGPDQKPPIRYDALMDCLLEVDKFCNQENATLHLPRIGSGLAGGNWKVIEALIEEIISVPVYVYDLQPIEGTEYFN